MRGVHLLWFFGYVITCELSPLTPERSEQLLLFLSKPEVLTLESLAKARVQHHEAKALELMVRAENTNDLHVAGNAEFVEAKRFQTFLDVLRLFKNPTEHKIAKLS